MMNRNKIPKSDEVKYRPYKLDIKRHNKVLVLSDIHVPYHNTHALDAAIEYGKEKGVNAVIINGDFLDCYQISSYEKDPSKRSFAEELKMGKEILEIIRICFKEAKIVYVMGNHEERYEKYMFSKAPELLGIDALDMYQLLDFGHLGIDIVRNKRYLELGNLTLLHGHELAGSSSSGVARALYNKTRTFAMCGHHHQTDEFSVKDIRQRATRAWTVGCLCELNPAYRPINKYNHGFAYIEFDGNNFDVYNKRIERGLVL